MVKMMTIEMANEYVRDVRDFLYTIYPKLVFDAKIEGYDGGFRPDFMIELKDQVVIADAFFSQRLDEKKFLRFKDILHSVPRITKGIVATPKMWYFLQKINPENVRISQTPVELLNQELGRKIIDFIAQTPERSTQVSLPQTTVPFVNLTPEALDKIRQMIIEVKDDIILRIEVLQDSLDSHDIRTRLYYFISDPKEIGRNLVGLYKNEWPDEKKQKWIKVMEEILLEWEEQFAPKLWDKISADILKSLDEFLEQSSTAIPFGSYAYKGIKAFIGWINKKREEKKLDKVRKTSDMIHRP